MGCMGGLKTFSVACVFLLFAACSRGGFFSNDNKTKVTVESVVVSERSKNLTLPAILEPSEQIDFQFPIDVKIDSVPVQLGDLVQEGAPLFTLNEQDFTLHLSQSRSRLMEKEALLEKNLYFLQNRDRLLQEGKIDQAMHDTLEAEVKKMEGEVGQLKADIGLTESRIQNINITAPFGGIVTHKNVAAGITARAGQKLLTLIQTDPIFLSFEVPAVDAGWITKGMVVDAAIKELGGKKMSGAIVFVSPELSQGNQTYTVKATSKNETQQLKSKMNAEIVLVSPQKVKLLSVPSQAVFKEEEKEYVFVVRENKAWRLRILTRPNTENQNLVDVLEGVEPNDMVITEGYQGLQTGAEVDLWR